MFMASEVIAGLYLGQELTPSPPSRHAIIHDLESFVWVLLYITLSTPDYDSARTFSSPSFTRQPATIFFSTVANSPSGPT